jgi:hypothetical protein
MKAAACATYFPLIFIVAFGTGKTLAAEKEPLPKGFKKVIQTLHKSIAFPEKGTAQDVEVGTVSPGLFLKACNLWRGETNSAKRDNAGDELQGFIRILNTNERRIGFTEEGKFEDIKPPGFEEALLDVFVGSPTRGREIIDKNKPRKISIKSYDLGFINKEKDVSREVALSEWKISPLDDNSFQVIGKGVGFYVRIKPFMIKKAMGVDSYSADCAFLPDGSFLVVADIEEKQKRIADNGKKLTYSVFNPELKLIKNGNLKTSVLRNIDIAVYRSNSEQSAWNVLILDNLK